MHDQRRARPRPSRSFLLLLFVAGAALAPLAAAQGWGELGHAPYEDFDVEEYVSGDFRRSAEGFDGDEDEPGDAPRLQRRDRPDFRWGRPARGTRQERDLYDDYDRELGPHWEWDPRRGEWQRDYGFFENRYEIGDRFYERPVARGGHYEYEPRSGRWKYDRGPYRPSYFDDPDLSDSIDVVTGRVDEVSRIPHRATNLIHVRLHDGRSEVIDLGRRVSLADLELEVGDAFLARGREVVRDGRFVLVAHEVRVAGEKRRVLRDGRLARTGRDPVSRKLGERRATRAPRGAARDRALDGAFDDKRQRRSDLRGRPGWGESPGDVVRIRGRVRDFRRLRAPGVDRTILRLELADGRVRVVDLGATTDLVDLDLERGAWIAVLGRIRRAGGRDVLVAENVQIRDGDFRLPARSERSAGRSRGFEGRRN